MTVSLNKDISDKLRRYACLLSRLSSEMVRLTGPKDEETIFKDHVSDCLFGMEFLPSKGKVVDVGTGGGLPGMVWALCRPDLEITLLDSQSRKTKALEIMAQELGLRNVRIICGRSEELAKSQRESFDLASARALAHLGVIAEYLSPLTAVGGKILAVKGPKYKEETDQVDGKWDVLGLKDPLIRPYENCGKKGYIVLLDKLSHCSGNFPRRPGKAEKSHWWEDKR